MIISIILKKLKSAFTDLLPIILVIAFFQVLVLKQPLPQMGEVLFGALLVVAGLSLFVQGLESLKQYAFGLRMSVAFSVGLAILIGVLRILRGWPIHYLIIGGYVLVMLMTIIAPKEIIGIAYDAGGVTTSTITVPLVAALGVGLASSIRGRSPLVDGFGLIAFASLLPHYNRYGLCSVNALAY